MKEQGGIDIRMVIRADGGPDPRRYNLPTAPEMQYCFSVGDTPML